MGASVIKKGRKVLLGKKVGMTQVFTEDGSWIPVTVLEVGPCTVLQVKTQDNDGYASLQVGFDDTTKIPARPQQGLFRKARVRPKKLIREIPPVEPSQVFRVPLVSEASGTVALEGFEPGSTLIESRVPRTRLVKRLVAAPAGAATEPAGDAEAEGDGQGAALPPGSIVIRDSGGKSVKSYPLPPGSSIEVNPGDTVADGDVLAYVPVGDEPPEEVAPGAQIGVTLFSETPKVDIRGVTKGRGFTGCIKRHGFNAGDKSHGSKNVREPGSTGMHTSPARVFKNKKMPGQHGVEQRKVKSLEIVEIDASANRMLVRGAVPGPAGGYVLIQESLS